MENSVIALITDFGEDDFFVASLKAAILKINPSARIVDISHRVGSFDVESASFILFSCYKYFPEKTVFLIVVDPGVGSSRRILLVETEKYFFIAPDNGILSLVLEEEKIHQIREITNEKFFLPRKGKTFDGRDKMAPVAALLSKGVSGSEFGAEVNEWKKSKMKKPRMKNNEIIGHILYTDKFGNLISNIPEKIVNRLQASNIKKRLHLIIKEREISCFKENYSSAKKGGLLFLAGSLGLIEIAAREDSAAKILKAKVGEEVKIIVKRKLEAVKK